MYKRQPELLEEQERWRECVQAEARARIDELADARRRQRAEEQAGEASDEDDDDDGVEVVYAE